MGANISALPGHQRLSKSFVTQNSKHLTINLLLLLITNEQITASHDTKSEHKILFRKLYWRKNEQDT